MSYCVLKTMLTCIRRGQMVNSTSCVFGPPLHMTRLIHSSSILLKFLTKEDKRMLIKQIGWLRHWENSKDEMTKHTILQDIAEHGKVPENLVVSMCKQLESVGCQFDEILEQPDLLMLSNETIETRLSKLKLYGFPIQAHALFNIDIQESKNHVGVLQVTDVLSQLGDNRTKIDWLADILETERTEVLHYIQRFQYLLVTSLSSIKNCIDFLKQNGMKSSEILQCLPHVMTDKGIFQHLEKWSKHFIELGFSLAMVVEAGILKPGNHYHLRFLQALVDFYDQNPEAVNVIVKRGIAYDDRKKILSCKLMEELSILLENTPPLLWVPKVYLVLQSGVKEDDVRENIKDLNEAIFVKLMSNNNKDLLLPQMTVKEVLKLIKKEPSQLMKYKQQKEALLKQGNKREEISYQMLLSEVANYMMVEREDPALHLASMLGVSLEQFSRTFDMSRWNPWTLITKVEFALKHGFRPEDILQRSYVLRSYSLKRIETAFALLDSGLKKPTLIQLHQVIKKVNQKTEVSDSEFDNTDDNKSANALSEKELKHADELAKVMNTTTERVRKILVAGSEIEIVNDKVKLLISSGISVDNILASSYVLYRHSLDVFKSKLELLKELDQPITMKGIHRIARESCLSLEIILSRKEDFIQLGVDIKNIPLRILLQSQARHEEMINALAKCQTFSKALQHTGSAEVAFAQTINTDVEEVIATFKRPSANCSIWRMLPKLVYLQENGINVDNALLYTWTLHNLSLKKIKDSVEELQQLGVDPLSLCQLDSMSRFGNVAKTMAVADKNELSRIFKIPIDSPYITQLARALWHKKSDEILKNIDLLKTYGISVDDMMKSPDVLSHDVEVLEVYLERDEVRNIDNKNDIAKLLNTVQYLIESDLNFRSTVALVDDIKTPGVET